MLLIPIFLFVSCCDEEVVLADLKIKKFRIPDLFRVDDPFQIEIQVLNEAPSSTCQIGSSSDETFVVIQVYRQNPFSDEWEYQGNKIFDQSVLESGEVYTILTTGIIFEAGTYRFDIHADFPDYVDERDENNNEYFQNTVSRIHEESLSLSYSNNFTQTTIEVLPNENGSSKSSEEVSFMFE